MTKKLEAINDYPQTITEAESKVQMLKEIIGNLFNSFSSNMFSLALGLMLLRTTNSPIAFGIESAITPIVSLLAMIPVGTITDRYPHKQILIICSLIKIATLILFGLIINYFSGFSKLIPVILLLTIISTTNSFSTTTYTASVKELVNQNFIPRLGSLNQSASAMSSVLAPIVGVALYSVVRFDVFILISVIVSLIWLGLTISMKFHYQPSNLNINPNINNSIVGQIKEFKEGLNYITTRKIMRDFILVGCMINFLFVAVTVGLPYTIIHHLHAGNSVVGVIDGLFSAGILTGSILLSIFPSQKHLLGKIITPLIITSLVMFLIGIYTLTYTAAFSFTVLCSCSLAIMGAFNSVLNISTSVYMQLTIPTYLLGRVMSTFTSLITCISPLGSIIFMFAFKVFSNGAYIFIGTGALLFIYVVLLTPLLIRDIKNDLKHTRI
ncbi:MFS transporter [Lentilactobacillus curieae]|uniref:MFS transporter n=1 Tax=Lentilactobacillus curieae TaxID=1138822 RepID=A0A1S6QIB2_9LACO|nr:MFS transporter [Lentilactobacillus curieae]AQW21342.1 MFS transporter [Lentilactobacillus curieae]